MRENIKGKNLWIISIYSNVFDNNSHNLRIHNTIVLIIIRYLN